MEDSEKDLILQRFGAHLKKLRNEQAVSLRILEQLSEVDHSQIHRIEKGTTSPSLLTLIGLARGLKIPLKHLTDFDFETD